jgi:hypothetical protein
MYCAAICTTSPLNNERCDVDTRLLRFASSTPSVTASRLGKSLSHSHIDIFEVVHAL